MAHVCPSWLSFILYNPVRKALTNRGRILDEAGVTRCAVVLEVGAGNGFLTEVLAGRASRVYAVELQAGMIRKLRRRVMPYGDRVVILEGDIASTPLERCEADVALLYYCFHEVRNKSAAAQNIAWALKQDGCVALYEPTVEVTARDMEETERIFEKAGCRREGGWDRRFTRFRRLRKTGKCTESPGIEERPS